MKQILIIILSLCSMSVFAQEPSSQPPVENTDKKQLIQTIEALKIAYMAKELNLSTEEAEKFWPLYNTFSEEIKKARIENKDDDIAFQEKKVVLMKKYKEGFKRLLINDDRVKKCFRAEPEFHKLLRKEWVRRQMQPNRPHRPNGGGNPNNGTRPPSTHPNHPSPNGGRGSRG
jgi:hypothetical protein